GDAEDQADQDLDIEELQELLAVHDVVSCRCGGSAARGQHAVDHHAGLAEVAGRVAHGVELRASDMLVDLGVRGEDLDQRPALGDRLAAKVVHQVVCVFTADVRAQAHHHGLRHDQAVGDVDV